MNILIVILLVIVAVVSILLTAALFMSRKHYVKRDIVINSPATKVFDYIKLLKNQDAFNKHAMTDSDRSREFRGTDGTVGYVYSWKGDKGAGMGEKEIKKITEGRRVEMEIRFVKPMKVTARIIMETEPLSDGKTRVSWINTGKLGYPMNIFIPMIEKSVVKDMDESLDNLKKILENS